MPRKAAKAALVSMAGKGAEMKAVHEDAGRIGEGSSSTSGAKRMKVKSSTGSLSNATIISRCTRANLGTSCLPADVFPHIGQCELIIRRLPQRVCFSRSSRTARPWLSMTSCPCFLKRKSI